jgi:hypothetical protein
MDRIDFVMSERDKQKSRRNPPELDCTGKPARQSNSSSSARALSEPIESESGSPSLFCRTFSM